MKATKKRKKEKKSIIANGVDMWCMILWNEETKGPGLEGKLQWFSHSKKKQRVTKISDALKMKSLLSG